MSEKLGEKPAFPAIVSFAGGKMEDRYQVGNYEASFSGMSQRLLIAKDAMCALISNKTAFEVALKSGFKDESVIVTAAYQYADELLRQEHLNK